MDTCTVSDGLHSTYEFPAVSGFFPRSKWCVQAKTPFRLKSCMHTVFPLCQRIGQRYLVSISCKVPGIVLAIGKHPVAVAIPYKPLVPAVLQRLEDQVPSPISCSPRSPLPSARPPPAPAPPAPAPTRTCRSRRADDRAPEDLKPRGFGSPIALYRSI